MNRKEALTRMALFEQTHPVEEYVCFDWCVWPLLRVQIAYEAVIKNLSENLEPTNPQAECGAREREGWRRFLPVKGLRKLLSHVPLLRNALPVKSGAVTAEDEFGDEHPAAVKGDVVFLTLSGRRLDLNGRYYEIYSDPIVSQLNTLGFASLVWERGLPTVPRYSRSSWIDRPLQAALLQQGILPPLPEPPWFKDLAPLAQELLERELLWGEVEGKIRRLQQSSLVFGEWLQAAGAKLLVSVCWYDINVMAATLAAKRLGLVSVDLQHGLQDEAHFAYSCWEGSPSGGYELVPGMFWNWGERQATQLIKNNPAFRTSSFIAAGNSWLNGWRTEGDNFIARVGLDSSFKDKLKKSTKRILVTLQGYGSYDDLVLSGIEKSPADWLWLIRLHPATRPEVARRLKERLDIAAPARVEYDRATCLPLYALLKACDIHVTGHSTCALEALAFGKPTIIVSQDGVDSYGDYIEAGVMAFAGDGEALVRLLAEFEVAPGQCETVAEKDSASPDQAALALLSLLEKAGMMLSSKGGENVPVE